MKKLLFLTLISAFLFSCDKEDFDIHNPDVESFVQLLKDGTYDDFAIGEAGENLWLTMPAFAEDHIAALLEQAEDTTHISDFPINPISSRTPHPQDRDYFILSECLLWIVEGVRNGTGYGSLDPYLIDNAKDEAIRYKGLSGKEILEARDLYQTWWNTNKDGDWESVNPLGDSSVRWF